MKLSELLKSTEIVVRVDRLGVVARYDGGTRIYLYSEEGADHFDSIGVRDYEGDIFASRIAFTAEAVAAEVLGWINEGGCDE